MNCPHCNSDLTVVNLDAKELLACKQCEGMWLHKNQLNSLLAEMSGDKELCSIEHAKLEDKESTISCLECSDQKMHKISFLEHSDIIFDYCEKCGSYWLNKDQIVNMHNYISKVKAGSHDVKEPFIYNFLVKLSELAYSIFSS